MLNISNESNLKRNFTSDLVSTKINEPRLIDTRFTGKNNELTNTYFVKLPSSSELKHLIETPNKSTYIPGSAGVFMLSGENDEHPFVVIKPAFIPMDYDRINPPTHLEDFIAANLAKDCGLLAPDTRVIPKNTELGNIIDNKLKEIPLYADKQKYATQHFYDPASFLLTAHINGKSLNSNILRPLLINELQDQDFRHSFYKEFAKHALFSVIVRNWDFFPFPSTKFYSTSKLNLSNILVLNTPVQNRYLAPIDMTIEAMSLEEFSQTKKLLIDLDNSSKQGCICEYAKFIFKNIPFIYKEKENQEEILRYIQEGLVELQNKFKTNSEKLVDNFLSSYKRCKEINNTINKGLTRFPNRLHISEKDTEMIVKTLRMIGNPYL